MSGIFDTGPPDPVPDSFNMAAYVLRHAERLSDKIALEVHGAQAHRTWTYGQIATAVREAAAGLIAQGLSPGDKVLMRLGNSTEFPVVYLGALWAGFVPIPTSAALTQPEVDWITADLRPALCVGQPTLPCPKGVPFIAPENLHQGVQCDTAEIGDPNRLGYVIYTSGSAGKPRAVGHAHRAVWARRMMYQGWYGLDANDRVFHAGAFNWTYTLGVGLMDPWAQGATALIRDNDVKTPDIPELLNCSKTSIFAAAPGVYRQILKSGTARRFPALRHGLSAGEALSDRIRTAWRDQTGTEIYEALGMSECSTYISACPGRQAPAGCAGFVQRGRRVTVLDSDGMPRAFGQTGTLAIHRRDPGLMLGYITDTRATAARMKGDWFDTGDRARLDPDGAVTFLGRDDDMMNAGGYRVSPLEVEAAFATLPGLSDCAAVDVAVKTDARVIALFYTGPNPLDEAALKTHAEAQLARYKQPRLYIHTGKLPHNANGKLNRKALRALYSPPEGPTA